MQFLIPMAGAGRRFREAGYRDPKPFINVDGRPMVAAVVEDLERTFGPGLRCFLHRAEDSAYVDWFARAMPGAYVPVPALTEGAACTALLAEAFLKPHDDLVIANSDQRFHLSAIDFRDALGNASAGVLTFPATESKWSYVVPNAKGDVAKIVEKPAVPPSPFATCGVYYFRRASDFFNAARAMIAADDRTNGEYYLAPAMNYLFGVIRQVPVDSMQGLGTPEDLHGYLCRR